MLIAVGAIAALLTARLYLHRSNGSATGGLKMTSGEDEKS